MRIEFNISPTSKVNLFPKHGWAKNEQGVKLLWLPIVRLVHNAEQIRSNQNLTTRLSTAHWQEIRTFHQKMSRLTLILREMHKLKNLAAYELGDMHVDIHEKIEAGIMLPLYVELCYVYFRRIGDELIRATRYVLFRNFESAPRELKNLQKLVCDTSRLRALVPICDEEQLINAVQNHTSWFSELRETTTVKGVMRKGTRDLLEHHSVLLGHQTSRVGDEPMASEMYLHQANGQSRELLSTVKAIVDDFCAFCTAIQSAVDWGSTYKAWVIPYGDCLTITGSDDDITGFWPEI
jgi:hypothetical protein